MPNPKILLSLALVAALAACGPAGANGDDEGPPADGPPANAPAATQALEVAEDLTLDHPDGAAVLRRDWEIEVEFDTNDHEAVVTHYHDWLTGAGFTLLEVDDEGDDDYEATYQNAAQSLRADLEIDGEDDNDDGDDGVDVDLDVTDTTQYAAGTAPAFDGLTFGTSGADLVFSFYDESLLDEIEWDFRVVYDDTTTNRDDLFAFFDTELTELGWTQIEDEDNEREYSLNDVELDIEIEADDDIPNGLEVEIELDKDRFY